MKVILYIIFFSVSLGSYAQIEFSKKNIKIAPKKIDTKPQVTPEEPLNEADPFAEKPIEIKKTTPEVAPKEETPEISMVVKESEFINPGDAIMQKLEKELNKALVKEGLQEDDRLLVKIDKKFGEIRTKSPKLIIFYRDYMMVDSDLIKATLNNAIIANYRELTASYNKFEINLKDGINTFEMEAMSKGTSGGNTCEFRIFDDKGIEIRFEQWNNWDAGVKGTFIIVKE